MTDRNVILVRHGAVDYSALLGFGPVYQGARHDFAPLDATKLHQVEALAPALAEFEIDLVISSPYTRTLQTGGIVASRLGVPLTVDLGLHDWLPVCDGSQPITSAIVQQKIAEYDHWRATGQLPPERTWETDDEMARRLHAVLDRAPRTANLVLVSHEAPIKAVLGADEVPLASWNQWSVSPS